MDGERITRELGNTLEENSIRENVYGEYHPSTISGCPLKSFLNWMTDSETTLNRWLFQGSAVHFYLQEKPGLLRDAMHDAGYHGIDTRFEVPKKYSLEDGAEITGRCDILATDGDEEHVIDIKYSSIPVHSGHGRLWKYASQVNCYANMFGADEWGLLMINSKSDNIPEDIEMINQEADEENFELIKSKAQRLHYVLEEFGYQDGERLSPSELDAKMSEVWDTVFDYLDKDNCPSYDSECDYCDHKEYCPVKQGEMGGLIGMGN